MAKELGLDLDSKDTTAPAPCVSDGPVWAAAWHQQGLGNPRTHKCPGEAGAGHSSFPFSQHPLPDSSSLPGSSCTHKDNGTLKVTHEMWPLPSHSTR